MLLIDVCLIMVTWKLYEMKVTLVVLSSSILYIGMHPFIIILVVASFLILVFNSQKLFLVD